VKGDKHINK